LDRQRSELLEPLGEDRRVALRLHPAAVANLRHKIGLAGQKADPENCASCEPISPRTPITTPDFKRAVWGRYTSALAGHEPTREITPEDLAMLDASNDFLLVNGFREVDQFKRKVQLAALHHDLAADETHQVEHEIDENLERRSLSAERGTV